MTSEVVRGSDGQGRDISAGPRRQLSPFVGIRRRVLDNGLTLLFLESRDHPVVSIRASVQTGVRHEPQEKAGLAYFTSGMLSEGAGHMNGSQFACSVDGLGAIYQTGIQGPRIQLLSRDFDTGLDLLAESVLRPTFESDEIEKKRQKIIDGLRSEQENPQIQAGRGFDRLVYGRHPFHRPAYGTMESVRRIRRRDIQTFHRTQYVPGNTWIAVCGDVDEEVVVARLQQAFGTWKARPLPRAGRYVVRRQRTLRQVWTEMPREQIHVYLGHLGVRRNHPDFPALRVLDAILGAGSGFTDRISKDLRDEKGLAYSVYASICTDAGRVPGTFRAYIGTKPAHFQAAVNGILDHVQRIRSEPVSREELECAIETVRGNYAFAYQTVSQRAGYMLFLERNGFTVDYPEVFLGAVSSVKPSDVLSVAQNVLDPEHYSLSVAGPRSDCEYVLKRSGGRTRAQGR